MGRAGVVLLIRWKLRQRGYQILESDVRVDPDRLYQSNTSSCGNRLVR